MSKSLKRVLSAIAGLMGLFILISLILFFFVDASFYKSRVERAVSDALGLDVRIGGKLGIALHSGLKVSLGDVQIRNGGEEIASAREASVEIPLAPLLERRITVRRIVLQRPTITVKRGGDGRFSFEPRKKTQGTLPAALPEGIFISGGTLIYQDEVNGKAFEVTGITLDVHGLRASGQGRAGLWKNLSFRADFASPEIRGKEYLFSDVKFTCKAENGLFLIDPLTLRLFGGKGSATVEADFSGAAPRYKVRSSLAGFRIASSLKTLSAKTVAEGALDFAANLSLQGNTEQQLRQTAAGEVILRGENLTLHGTDLDQAFARFESSQSFNLIDAGAFFFAGPLGLALTKGYSFATVLEESGGTTRIGKLFSHWKIAHGKAQAMDVAMATGQNRIALKGRLDFVKERFDDMTMALIDARGCVRVQQKIRGPFRKPVVEKPNVLISLAGPALSLLRQAGNLITGATCDPFYTGSVAAPK